MEIAGSVALVTGANRGLGRAFARDVARSVKAALPDDLRLLYPAVQRRYDAALAAAAR